MTDNLSDLFERAKSPTVMWNGQVVHSMYEMPAADKTVLRIEFADPNPARPQGLRLKAKGGSLRIEGRELDDVVLWSDSAPRVVTVEVRPKRGSAVVRVWNCWRDPAETVQAWIGNAGMLVEETANGIVLRCSDGYDDVTFDDLIVVIAGVPVDSAP